MLLPALWAEDGDLAGQRLSRLRNNRKDMDMETMTALFMFKDGNTKQMEIPVANPWYYFPVMRSLRSCWNYAPEELDKPVPIEKIEMRRVTPTLDDGFVLYEET